LVTE